MKLSRQGQGALEAVLCLPILLATAFALGLLLYRGLIYSYSDYQLREALICADGFSIKHCEGQLKKRIKAVLLDQSKLTIDLKDRADSFSAEIKIKFHAGDSGVSEVFNKLSPEFYLKKETTKKL
ncbi:hypothetical protein [Bdellovibrio reynosensis]|uniref:Pilus assembly protein n=1 Tax=Bdellovibrio reynosensis TaxID=2835041 RepID=A0ABY4C7W1_9BACT|nr:hypothetical protein [Bdellovibrio reynosensis]UOF00963.1 hypothetical protein MNR06_14775 [Bdellovibrio reynosensis]